MRFVGRSQQLERLDGWFGRVTRDKQGLLVAVRGRRQVGKSTLYTQFLERSGASQVFFTAIKDAGATAQLEAFQRNVHEAAPAIPDAAALFAGTPSSWTDVFGRLSIAAQQSPIIVVIDELPWATQAAPSFEGELQAAWDRDLQHLPILLILIGSDVAMMERVTQHDRPLYGRAREDVLGAFNPAEVAASLGSSTSAFTAFDAHLATGGYPKLVDDFARAGSIGAFVADGLADENSNLVVLAQRSLAAEFPPEAQARRVLSAIGGDEVGHATFSSVVGRIHEDGITAGTALTRALKILAESTGVIAIETPIGHRPRTKLRRYRITDPHLRFWFRFVEPQLSNIARGRSDLAIAAFDRGFESWRGVAIEPEVQAAVLRLAPDIPALASISDVGSWWNRQHSVEVDLVAAHGASIAAIGSIKWRPRRAFHARELHDLARTRSVVAGAGDARLVAVCPAGVRDGVEPDVALDAADLVAAWRS